MSTNSLAYSNTDLSLHHCGGLESEMCLTEMKQRYPHDFILSGGSEDIFSFGSWPLLSPSKPTTVQYLPVFVSLLPPFTLIRPV